MAITKNWTYSSDGGYAASKKQKEYAPESVRKKASLMLREQERQRLIEAAKRLDAQTRGAAAAGNSGFGTVNNRQTFPEVIAANRNAGAGNMQSSSAAPRNVRDILDQPESTWRSGSFNGVINPRTKNEFLNSIGTGNSAPKPAPKPAEKPAEEKKPEVFLSDAQKTRYGLWSNMGEIAGKKVDVEPIREWLAESKNREYKPTHREEFLYNRNKDMGDIAGGDFYDYFIKFKNPSMVNYTPPHNIQLKQKVSNGVYNGYVNGEEYLNREEFDSNLEYLMVADFNRFRAKPAKVTSDVLNMVADCIGELTGEEKSAFCNWLRSMEDNSEILEKSEKQYSQVDYDNEFINGLVVGVNKDFVDMSSQAFMGGILKIPTKSLSNIYSATEIYNAAREKGYSVEDAMCESGAIAIVNKSASFALDSLKYTDANKGTKDFLEILVNTTTKTASDMWFENNGEEGSLSIEGIANTLAVEAAVKMIAEGGKKILSMI